MTSPAIQLAIKAGMTCYGGANLPPGHHSWQAYTSHIEKLVTLAQAKALRDAASKFRGEIGYNFVAADGYSNGFDVASELDFMSEELEKQA